MTVADVIHPLEIWAERSRRSMMTWSMRCPSAAPKNGVRERLAACQEAGVDTVVIGLAFLAHTAQLHQVELLSTLVAQ